MGAVGYAYTRAKVVDLGSEYAVHLGMKRKDDKHLSLRWFYGFTAKCCSLCRVCTLYLVLRKKPTTTVMGCGNALGHQIPPYFIFAGKRIRQELLEGATPGADGSVSETGWSNSEIFQSYLETHFIKYVTGMQDKHSLLLYDGHSTHITPDVIDWALRKKIILYVLPPHTSHVLQPMDVGCFGPFARIYSSECHKFQRTNSSVINK
ncbi:LOW QUALITY PROTEIN: uncharacterized protein LOC143069829 [Mytilus galloprovincialis]|uniref:LOW QUALITY PROTEIN: uncharacterized protein LOC143069829 n=1 Tax=Mytilus galloprovincialis TaxID=29158 RepID=UPI003F7BE3FD